MIEEGFEFLRLPPRHRYVGFYGDEEIVATLRSVLKWNTYPYPKRGQFLGVTFRNWKAAFKAVVSPDPVTGRVNEPVRVG